MSEKVQMMLTPKAASERTGIPVSIISQALRNRELTYVQPNGRRGWRLIKPDDLDAWVKRVTVTEKVAGS